MNHIGLFELCLLILIIIIYNGSSSCPSIPLSQSKSLHVLEEELQVFLLPLLALANVVDYCVYHLPLVILKAQD